MSLFAREFWRRRRWRLTSRFPWLVRPWSSYNGRYEIERAGREYRLWDRTERGRCLCSGSFDACAAAAEADSPGLVISPDYLVYDRGRYVWDKGRSNVAWAIALGMLKMVLSRPEVHRLVLLVGLPGSGKTTWLAAQAESGAVYLDATNLRRTYRTKLVKLAHKAGKPTEAVVFSTPLAVCAERNALRPVDRRIPDEAMERLAGQWEPIEADEALSGVVTVPYAEI